MVALFQRLSNPRGALANSPEASDEIGADATPEPSGTTTDRTVQKQVRLSSEQVDDLVAAYQAGCSVRDCARDFGVHRTTVMSHLERRGVERRAQGRKLDDEAVAHARSLFAAGQSAASIAREYEVDAETVRRALHNDYLTSSLPSTQQPRLTSVEQRPINAECRR